MSDLPTEHSLPPGDDGLSSISTWWGQGQARKKLTFGYLAALLATLAGLVIVLMPSWELVDPLWVVLLLAILGAAAERGSARLSKDLEVSISLLPMLFAAVAIGPYAAMIVGAASMLTLPVPIMRWAVYTTARALTGGVVALVAGAIPEISSGTFAALAIASLAAAACAQLLDLMFSAVTMVLRHHPILETLRSMGQVALVSVPLHATVIAPLAYVFESISPWWVLFFLPPALLAQRLYHLYQEQRELAEGLTTANKRLERANLSFARSLVTALDARDRYTAGHSAAVAIYARDIATRIGLSDEEQATAHLAGLLHDIGKVGLPPGILEKPGPLTDEEFREMQEHSVIGERILRNVEDYAEIATIVRHHHERIDGRGYPDGIGGTDIPTISRILCVADAYNAMTSGRPYRSAMPIRDARQRMIDASGTQFDHTVVAIFERILSEAGELYSRGVAANFAVEAQAHGELAQLPTHQAA